MQRAGAQKAPHKRGICAPALPLIARWENERLIKRQREMTIEQSLERHPREAGLESEQNWGEAE